MKPKKVLAIYLKTLETLPKNFELVKINYSLMQKNGHLLWKRHTKPFVINKDCCTILELFNEEI